MSMSTFNEMMNKKNFHIVIDGNTPLGGVKFVNNENEGDEIIVYPDGAKEKIEACAVEAEEVAVTEAKQEEKVMKTMKTTKKKQHNHRGIARFLAEKAVAGALKASYGAGFATGFTKESIKLAGKNNKLVNSFKEGFHAGEEAARKKAENKDANKAAKELMEEFYWSEKENEFNERFADCIYCDYPNCDECHLRTW